MWDWRHGPYRARLNLLNRGGTGAWSTRYNNVFQWIQIDLGEVSKVVAVATQGRYDANQWVKKYEISYGLYGNKFKFYTINRKVVVRTVYFSPCICKNVTPAPRFDWLKSDDYFFFNFSQMFAGNSDRNTVVFNRLYPSFRARYVRFYPKQWHSHISMRAELYGCNRGKETLNYIITSLHHCHIKITSLNYIITSSKQLFIHFSNATLTVFHFPEIKLKFSVCFFW